MSEAAIRAEYAPYDRLRAFDEGWVAYRAGIFANPYDGQPKQGVAAQAWDRGLEAAMRMEQMEPQIKQKAVSYLGDLLRAVVAKTADNADVSAILQQSFRASIGN